MKKIFLLEDEDQIREILVEYLSIAGYETISAPDGDTAMNIINEENFDLAILDIMVPGKNGIEVLRAIRNKNATMGIIMLSALSDEKIQVDAFNEYADDYITKPFSPILLLKRLETLIRRLKNNTNEINQKDIFISDESYRAFYNGKDLHLTLTEFQILQALFNNPNKVFTRENIIEIIYSGDYYGSDRVIDSHIKNLRKKLPKNYVKTVVGVGYQFDRE